MTFAKNLGRIEQGLRILLGGVLVVVGFFLPSFWRPVFIVIGILLVLTAFVGY